MRAIETVEDVMELLAAGGGGGLLWRAGDSTGA